MLLLFYISFFSIGISQVIAKENEVAPYGLLSSDYIHARIARQLRVPAVQAVLALQQAQQRPPVPAPLQAPQVLVRHQVVALVLLVQPRLRRPQHQQVQHHPPALLRRVLLVVLLRRPRPQPQVLHQQALLPLQARQHQLVARQVVQVLRPLAVLRAHPARQLAALQVQAVLRQLHQQQLLPQLRRQQQARQQARRQRQQPHRQQLLRRPQQPPLPLPQVPPLPLPQVPPLPLPQVPPLPLPQVPQLQPRSQL
ncbi:unnamed protein product [Adineta ricciae]|uniref:Uncharacterized protein n=1 Tax=Adineta ricciae TaxID=249248 RepID=A0A814IU37_ADIRI|nr:unnamed protein product [Adineta ricciae]CAF1120401.1 unnamed protein product [Adineta ricciae]